MNNMQILALVNINKEFLAKIQELILNDGEMDNCGAGILEKNLSKFTGLINLSLKNN